MLEVAVLFSSFFSSGLVNETLLALNTSFPCHSFVQVKRDADVYLFVETAPCYSVHNGGCYYGDARIGIHRGFYVQPKKYWLAARNGTMTHEFQHFFGLSADHRINKSTREQYEERYCG